MIYTLVKPKFAIPVHGEYRHMLAQRRIARNLGIPKNHIMIMQTGEVLEIDQNGAKINGTVKTGAILVDGLGVGDVGNVVLRDRQHLAEDGIVVVVFGIDTVNGVLQSEPAIVSRGFVYVKESDELIEEASQIVGDELQEALDRGTRDWGKLKGIVKDALSGYLWKKTNRRPMILPIIMDTND